MIFISMGTIYNIALVRAEGIPRPSWPALPNFWGKESSILVIAATLLTFMFLREPYPRMCQNTGNLAVLTLD